MINGDNKLSTIKRLLYFIQCIIDHNKGSHFHLDILNPKLSIKNLEINKLSPSRLLCDAFWNTIDYKGLSKQLGAKLNIIDFDYLGNSKKDLPIWEYCNKIIYTNVSVSLKKIINTSKFNKIEIKENFNQVDPLNIEIGDDLLKALKLLALSRNIKLNTLCKEILYEKIKLDIPGEINKSVSDELDEIKKRISILENS